MNKLLKNTVVFCFLMLAFTPVARSQDQSSTTSQPAASSAQTKAKAKPSGDEPEAGTAEAAEALQKATQNPVASLISVPVQDNTNFGVNPGYRNQNVLNIQPVIPIGISKDWNLARTLDYADRVSTDARTLRELPKRASTVWETWCLHFSYHRRSQEN